MKQTFSSIHPIAYSISVNLRQIVRYLKWSVEKHKFAKEISSDKLNYRVYKHQSVLIRKLGEVDMVLQYNKVENLKLAVGKLNGILIHPGETFSFCFLVGKPTKRKGYKEGMQLSHGEAISGIGGGICQIANLIHWLCLHSPLTVTERHHHSFDPFPDSGRVVPFGSGASVFYNYQDYQFKNETDRTFQLLFWFDKKCINGDLRVDEELPYKYHVFEKNHHFYQKDGVYYRKNELWRRKYLKEGSSAEICTELIQRNDSLVKYKPPECI